MKRLLIVSPHWSPINAADMQRVRLGLPHYRAFGWEPTVLAIAPEFIEGGVREPLLEKSYPADIRVLRTGGLRPAATRRFGFGSLWLRCGAALRRAGDALLARERFDLAFFSTTQFSAFSLGPRWRHRHGLRYVLDYQDPWRNAYYARTGTPPPGGALKFRLSQLEAAWREPAILRDAAGVVAVSEDYGPMLHRLYPWFVADTVRVLPFGCSEDDFTLARAHPPAAPLINFDDGNVHLVYVGRGGPDMATSLRALFTALARYRQEHPNQAARLRLHFIGTGYAPPPLGRESVLPVARTLGVEALVREHCYRVPYFEALHYLSRAHALLAVGSDDPSYSPSKIHLNLMARRPLLLIYHERSLACDVARRVGGAVLVPFTSTEAPAQTAHEVYARWFAGEAFLRLPGPDPAALAPYGARASAARLCAVFDEASARPA